MKLFWIFIVVSLISGNSIYCQDYLWQKDNGYSNFIGAVLAANSEEILVIDNRIIHSAFGLQTNYKDIIVYSFSFATGFGDSLLISDNTYPLFCANAFDIDGHNYVGYGTAKDDATNTLQSYLFYFDEDLNFLKDTILHFDTCDISLSTHIRLSDNSFIISGKWYSKPNPGLVGSVIIMLDSSGFITDVKFLKCSSPPIFFVEFPDFAGFHGVSGNDIRYYPYDFNMDSLIWNKPLVNATLPSPISLLLGNGNYIQICRMVQPFSPYIQNAFFLRDNNGNILDTIVVALPDTSENLWVNGLKLSSMGDVLMGQTVYHALNDPGYLDPIVHDMTISCLSNTGVEKWIRKIGMGVYFDLQYLSPMNDGGCVIAGTIWDWNTTWPSVKDNMFLARLSQNGELLSGISESMVSKVLVYPNPVSEIMYVELVSGNCEFFLYDITGVIQIHSYVYGKAAISLYGIPNGIYVYNLKDQGCVFQSGKIAVAH